MKPVILLAIAWVFVIGFAVYDLGRGSGFAPYNVTIDATGYAGRIALVPRIDARFRGQDSGLGDFCTIPARLPALADSAEDARAAIDALQQYGLITATPGADGVIAIAPSRWTAGPLASLRKAFTFHDDLSCYKPLFAPYLFAFMVLAVFSAIGEVLLRRQGAR